jgi:hypothetical protein
MNADSIRELLDAYAAGTLNADAAVARIADLPLESLGFASIDHHRGMRCGCPEVIYCAGKTPEQVATIFTALAARGDNVLATRATQDHADAVLSAHPRTDFDPLSRCLVLRQKLIATMPGAIAILAAGTSDLPVAEEARITAELMGQRVETCYDVGVAGLHRLMRHQPILETARVLVVVAGMEGALLSVVAGLVRSPVIGVPTSVGYGASFGGLAALLAMLNSCAAGTAVVNIDNGFGAGYMAATINRVGQSEPHA